jgi:hypothetical protein
MKTIFSLPIAVSIFSIFSIFSFAANAGRAEQEALQPVEVHQIQLGGFWKQQIKRLTEQWLPHCIRQMEAGGAGQELLNLVHTGKASAASRMANTRACPGATLTSTTRSRRSAWHWPSTRNGDAATGPGAGGAPGQGRTVDPDHPGGPVARRLHPFVPHGQRPSALQQHQLARVLCDGLFPRNGRRPLPDHRRQGSPAVRRRGAVCRSSRRTFGPPPKRTWKNGHAGWSTRCAAWRGWSIEVEGAGAGDKYARLAKHFLDHQHEIQPNAYDQSNRPAVEMTEAEGHAVRATYFYTAMADMAC